MAEAAEAEEPLMRDEPSRDEAQDVDLSDVDLLLEKNLHHPGIFVWLLTFSAGISGLLFGCKFVQLNCTANTNVATFRRHRCHLSNSRLYQ
jgi:hypothetical protein